VNADATGGLAYTRTEFEELGTQGFDLGRAPGRRQVVTEEVDQVVGATVQKQAKRIGQKAMTAQAVGTEPVFELLDAVLTLAAIIVESEDLRSAAGTVGHNEPQVGSGCGVFGLVADATLMGPAERPVAEAGKTALRQLGVAIASF